MEKKQWITVIWAVVCILGLGIETAKAQGSESDSLWEPIFNGVDLDDWDVKIQGQEVNVDPNNTFRVEDSVLVMDYENYSGGGGFKFGHIFYNKPFSFYILRVEYRFVGSQYSSNPGSWALQNNGMMLHSQSAESMGLNQDFPMSLEAQLLGSGNRGADDNSTLNLCTPGTAFYTQPSGGNRNNAHCTSARTNDRPDIDEWAWASALVLGDSILMHFIGPDVTGTPEITYYRPVQASNSGVSGESINIQNNEPITEGYISFQSESHPTQFRTIEVLNLVGCMDEEAANYKDYYIRHDEDACEEVIGVNTTHNQGSFQWRSAEGLLLLPESAQWDVSVTSVNGTVRTVSAIGKQVSLAGEGKLVSGMYVVRAAAENYDITQKIFVP